MQGLLLLIICCITLADFCVTNFGFPAALRFSPEMLSAIIILFVLAFGIRNKFRFVSTKYWLVLGAFAFIILAGIITNGVEPGPILAGTRFYLRAIPLFFLPAVFSFTEQQVRWQLRLLLAFGLLQVPLASYQRRVVWLAERFSGDSVSGTLMDSGVLSIFLICSVLVLTGLFLRGRVSKFVFFALFFILLFPTTINETKVTVIILPIGLFAVFLIGAQPGQRLRVAAWAAVMLTAFAALFIPIYDLMEKNNPYKREIVDFFSDQKKLDAYMENRHAGVGGSQQVGRLDTVVVPLQYLSHDAVRLAFGLGVGNASHSSLGQNYSGRYYSLFQRFVYTSLAIFMLEIGILGIGLVVLLNWMILADTIAVARADGTSLTGSIAVGWTGVVIIVSILLAYSVIHAAESISYLYWYISGIIAARRTQMAIARVSEGTKLPAGHRSNGKTKARAPGLASSRGKIGRRTAGRAHSSL